MRRTHREQRVCRFQCALCATALFGTLLSSGQTTERVSVSSTGVQTDFDSAISAISDDGRYVAFSSKATTLVVPDPDGPARNVFVRDRQEGLTELVGILPDGSPFDVENGYLAISGSGRYVLFGPNCCFGHVYVRDRGIAGDPDNPARTVRVSVNSNGDPADGSSIPCAISSNGRFIVFQSTSTNLDPFRAKTNLGWDVYVHDRDPDADGIFDEPGAIKTVRVSLGGWNPDLFPHADYEQGNSGSEQGSVSDDGRFVVFSSLASNLDYFRVDNNGFGDVFVHDRDWDGGAPNGIFDEQNNPVGVRTVRISITSAVSAQCGPGAAPPRWGRCEGNHDSGSGVISGDGRFVAFASWASNLINDGDVPDDPSHRDVFVHDRDADHNDIFDEQDEPLGTKTILISRDSTGRPGNGGAEYVCISSTGRYVAYLSDATNLVLPERNPYADVFLRDRDADEDGVFDEPGAVATTRVNISSGCAQANERSERAPAVSTSGQFVAFDSHATNLVPGDTNNQADIFVRDRGICMVPSVTLHPVSTEPNEPVYVCDTAVLETHAIGDPPLAYQWRKYGTPGDPNTATPLSDAPGHIAGAQSNTLTLWPTDPNDSGMYDCVVTNNCQCSETWSAPATLTVSWRLGDMNCDGSIDFADIDAFVRALSGPGPYYALYPNCRYLNADCDGDGYVTFGDIDPFVGLLFTGCQ